jgi:bacteriocin-like protein
MKARTQVDGKKRIQSAPEPHNRKGELSEEQLEQVTGGTGTVMKKMDDTQTSQTQNLK